MVELVDTSDLRSEALEGVRVRVSLRVQINKICDSLKLHNQLQLEITL